MIFNIKKIKCPSFIIQKLVLNSDGGGGGGGAVSGN